MNDGAVEKRFFQSMDLLLDYVFFISLSSFLFHSGSWFIKIFQKIPLVVPILTRDWRKVRKSVNRPLFQATPPL